MTDVTEGSGEDPGVGARAAGARGGPATGRWVVSLTGLAVSHPGALHPPGER